jgi:hypothetical protein
MDGIVGVRFSFFVVHVCGCVCVCYRTFKKGDVERRMTCFERELQFLWIWGFLGWGSVRVCVAWRCVPVAILHDNHYHAKWHSIGK